MQGRCVSGAFLALAACATFAAAPAQVSAAPAAGSFVIIPGTAAFTVPPGTLRFRGPRAPAPSLQRDGLLQRGVPLDSLSRSRLLRLPVTRLQMYEHPVWPPESRPGAAPDYEVPIWPPGRFRGDMRIVPAGGAVQPAANPKL